MSYDVRRMLLLAEVARHGSLTGAASALNYTPSAVSQQVSRLEAEVGQPLVQRHARGVSLTEAGHTLSSTPGGSTGNSRPPTAHSTTSQGCTAERCGSAPFRPSPPHCSPPPCEPSAPGTRRLSWSCTAPARPG
jgi:hypothetical protein